jgi:Domain of unknown function (DUF4157)
MECVMFASRIHNQVEKIEGRRPERGDSTSYTKTTSEQNPLWQSIAMRSGLLQPKLTISQADDPYEREADRVADQVMRMPAPHSDGNGLSITPVTAHQAQRKCAECEDDEESALQRKESGGAAEAPVTSPPIVHQALSSPGQPLDAETRAYFEPRFGHDFSGVRIHTGGDAVSATHAVRARAFTLGDRIAFSAGQYSPRSETGRRLLAHELTHVAQQERLGHSSEKMLLQREPIEGDDACSQPPLMMTEDEGCSLHNYGATTWTMRLSNFVIGQHALNPCHEKAITDFVSKANNQATTDPEIGGWWVTSIKGHASPEGGEEFNESLGLRRADEVFTKLGNLMDRNQGMATPVSSGEKCGQGAPRSDYPYFRAVDIVIEFYSESPKPPDPRVNEDLEKSGVSYELGNPPTPTVDELASGAPPQEYAFLEGLDEDRRRVMGWLLQYKDEIQMQELLRGVDRRAIAGAIAWEALVNVKESVDHSRAAGGPGKVHVQSSHGIDMRLSAPAEVEERGLVPKRTYDERVEVLKTPGGAIDYIGAIMQAMAEDAETSGFDIWRDPAVLTWGYQSKYVDTFRERMQEKARAGEKVFDTSSSDMAVWTVGNLHYLELCVGEPSARNTGSVAPNPEPLPGGPTP